MNISSTEFQQHVGYYLGLVEQGEEIEITRQKPTRMVYQIIPKKQKNPFRTKPEKNNSKWKNILETLDKQYKFDLDTGNMTSLEAQRKARGYKI